MKLATLKVRPPRTATEAKDGQLVVVSPDARTAAPVPGYPTMLSAIEDWSRAEFVLRRIEDELASGGRADAVDLASQTFMAPLPRTWAWLDGSAFLHHVVLVRRARGAEPPEDLYKIPLMYQGISDGLLGPNDDLLLVDAAHGMDFEAEVAVVLDDVPLGTTPEKAASHVKLLVLMNDVSLRNLIPRELAAGFGFFHGKPASSFGPFAITPDESGPAWQDGRLALDMNVALNGRRFGHPNGREMYFSFFDLVAHATKTRSLSAGTILGSGTFSNEDPSVGSSCLAERRMIEILETGKPATPFLEPGDRIEIEVLREDGRSLFGKIDQQVVAC